MAFEDFVREYDTVYLCRVFSERHGWRAARQAGAWRRADGTAAGCSNHRSYHRNPQYRLVVGGGASATVVVTLTQYSQYGGLHSLIQM